MRAARMTLVVLMLTSPGIHFLIFKFVGKANLIGVKTLMVAECLRSKEIPQWNALTLFASTTRADNTSTAYALTQVNLPIFVTKITTKTFTFLTQEMD